MNTSNLRAWGHREDRDNYEMFYDFSSFDEYFCPWNEGFAICDHTLMRYTTLNDSNKKPLFEDDIVRTTAMSNDLHQRGATEIVVIRTFMGSFCFCFNNNESGVAIYPFTVNHKIEIIGNLHENPKLIK